MSFALTSCPEDHSVEENETRRQIAVQRIVNAIHTAWGDMHVTVAQYTSGGSFVVATPFIETFRSALARRGANFWLKNENKLVAGVILPVLLALRELHTRQAWNAFINMSLLSSIPGPLTNSCYYHPQRTCLYYICLFFYIKYIFFCDCMLHSIR